MGIFVVDTVREVRLAVVDWYREFRNINSSVPDAEVLTRARIEHYARNDNQANVSNYVDAIVSNLRWESDSASAFHQLNYAGSQGNQFNSKWTSEGGSEFVFQYVGSAETGGFRLVTDDRNMGTYNFYRGPSVEHRDADIYPWVLWGNTAKDGRQWSAEDRMQTLLDSEWAGLAGYFDIGPRERVTARSDGVLANERAEVFIGRGRSDLVSFADSDRAISVNLFKKDGYDGWARGDSFRGIEHITGSDWGDIITGNAKSNRFEGGGGRDTLLGQAGNDRVDGGAGDDFLWVVPELIRLRGVRGGIFFTEETISEGSKPEATATILSY